MLDCKRKELSNKTGTISDKKKVPTNSKMDEVIGSRSTIIDMTALHFCLASPKIGGKIPVDREFLMMISNLRLKEVISTK